MNSLLVGFTTTALVAGIPFVSCSISGSIVPGESIESYVKKADNSGLIMDNSISYSYINENYYFEESSRMIDKRAKEFFGIMRSATNEELKGVEEAILKTAKKTGVNFWDLC